MNLREPNIERLLAAYRGKKLDRVPNFEISIDPGALHRIMNWGDDKPSVRSDALGPEDAAELAKKTCQDAIMANADFWVPGAGCICGWDDLYKLKEADPDEMRRKVKSYTDYVQHTNIGVGVMVAGPFFTTYWEMGPIPIQSFMLNVYDDLPLIEKLMDFQLENQLRIVEALEGLPISFVEIADDVAVSSGFFIQPALMERIWAPRIEKLINAVKRLNVPVQFHCCGKLDDVLPYFDKFGVDAITPIQTSCNDIYGIRKKYGDRFCLVGNMNIEGVLAFGTPEEVAKDTKEHIDLLAKNGSYVVASSHSIADAIPRENYFAMVETAIKHGRFT
jgi:uroporphyrinogen decarboxylase